MLPHELLLENQRLQLNWIIIGWNSIIRLFTNFIGEIVHNHARIVWVWTIVIGRSHKTKRGGCFGSSTNTNSLITVANMFVKSWDLFYEIAITLHNDNVHYEVLHDPSLYQSKDLCINKNRNRTYLVNTGFYILYYVFNMFFWMQRNH